MVAPVIAALTPFVKGLFANGLSLLGNAILSKGKAAVEEKLGIKLPDENVPPTHEQLIELRQLEFDHEEKLLELDIEKQKLELESDKLAVENTQGARDMNTRIQESANADHIAKVAAYYLDFLVVGVTLIVAILVIFVDMPATNEKIAFMALGSLLTLCGTIVNFHRGTSASSKGKDETILHAMKGLK